jgi:hypothetical protein
MKILSTRLKSLALLFSAAIAAWSPSVRAEFREFYIGIDTRPTITFGTYLGLPNPNQGRLTMLYAHVFDTPEINHFHGIGVHSYTGPVDMAVETTTNGNNRLPETYTGQAPLTLLPGSGTFAGKLISGLSSEHYGNLTLASIHELSGFAPDAPETYLYNSSGLGYQGDLTGVSLGLEIVSITPGLFVGLDGLGAGDTLVMGDIAATPFEPIFWTDAGAAPGTYSAELRLYDMNDQSSVLPSGTFFIDFAVVPEPTSTTIAALLVVSGLLVSGRATHRIAKLRK